MSFLSGSITIGSDPDPTTTELEVGEGKDIVNNAGTAVVSGSVSGNTATLNVACDQACVVAYTTDGGTTYTRLTATANGDAYDFSVENYDSSMQFVVAVKGDVDGNGGITPSDWGSLIEAYNGSELSDLSAIIGDVDGSGGITPSDWGSLIEAYNGSSLAWN